MKKGISILLLLIFLFNVGGYYIVFWGIRLQLDRRLTERLDSDLYDKDETLELKIPMTLPYPIQSRSFERVDGRFEHQGIYYKLIKQKLQNDTLHIVCIRDYGTKALVATMKEFISVTVGQTDEDALPQALNFLSKLVKDFYSQSQPPLTRGDDSGMVLTFGYRLSLFLQPTLSVHSPPPRG